MRWFAAIPVIGTWFLPTSGHGWLASGVAFVVAAGLAAIMTYSRHHHHRAPRV